MWRALIVILLLGLAATGAVWLANYPETIALTWRGREYATSLSVGVVAFIGLAIVLAVAFGLIRFLLTAPAAFGRNARRRKQERGYAAVTRGIVAVGSGDIAAARRHAGEAERLLGHQPLALLLKAQAAQAAGNREAAEATFRDMTEQPDTRVLGLRGLYLEARRSGDDVAARHYAEEAARVAPAVAWAGEAVLEAHSAEGDWRGALQLIDRRTSLGLIDRATSRRQRAVLHAADAIAREEQDPHGALEAAEQAIRLAPDLVPAAAIAGRLLSRRGDMKRAAAIIEKAWKAMPHPELAAVYLNVRSGDSATDRLHRAETLARLSSWSAESRFAIARAAIEARELPRARETLRPLADDRPTVRVCLMMAELERRDGNAGAAREWLSRAARAPRDKAWMADGIVAERWAPISPASGRIDAFRWETPPELLGTAIPDDMPAPEEEPRHLPPIAPPRNAAAPPIPATVPPASADAPPVPPIVLTPAAEAVSPLAPKPAKPVVADPPAAIPPAAKPVPASPAAASPAPASSAPAEASRPAPGPPAAPGRTDGVPKGMIREPEPVIFPVPRPPDDPGLDRDGDARQRARILT